MIVSVRKSRRKYKVKVTVGSDFSDSCEIIRVFTRVPSLYILQEINCTYLHRYLEIEEEA